MTLRVGIIGSGSMGTTHAAAWMNTPAHVVGIQSLDQPARERIAAQTGAMVYDDLDALIDAVDVVDICAPTHLHHDMILRAAAKRKHIICEKPITRRIADAREAIAACEAAGVMLLIAHVVRFFPEYALAQQTVVNGAIGNVAVVRLSRCSYPPHRDNPDSWFHDPAKSGGILLDLMIHDFDYARWIAGDVESIYVRSIKSRVPDAPIDHALAILRHISGALSHIEGGSSYPPPTFRTSLEIAGSAGLIAHPADSSMPLTFRIAERAATIETVALPRSPLDEDPYTTEMKHFYGLLTGTITTPRVTADDALQALRISTAAALSAQTGKPVFLAEVE
ncbi:MAG: Gfo/Idh/MocA family oxidoreductase [Chloroflexota bacterium]|nr:Gfo/Idh/MocA family oxidoreductase [Chloroflexota bacterium]